MSLLFWMSLLLVFYAYFGYAGYLAVYARLHPRPVRRGEVTPTVSIIMAARNEQGKLPIKFRNFEELDYPAERLQIVVASDGSTDGTNEILLGQGKGITPVILSSPDGKAMALNAAVRAATGEVLVFLDVRQRVDHDSVRELVACFADPEVGAVSGELLLETAAGEISESALGIYWRIEKIVRRLESASGSVVGVTGAIYAMRRELYVDIPKGTILDDVYVPLMVVRGGRRVIFQPRAIARDVIFTTKGKEFSRKVRTLSGNYQLLGLAPWLLTPSNPILFRFVSHKLMRLLVPLLLVVMLVTSALIGGRFFSAVLVLQGMFYALALLGAVNPRSRQMKLVALANTFVMLNVAAALAFYNFIRGRDALWPA